MVLNSGGGEDLWTSTDKLYHVVFCFSLTIVFNLFFSHHPLLRRSSLFMASCFSLLVGAAKEAVDHFGYFNSSGASVFDGVADIFGVLLACSLLYLSNKLSASRKSKIDDQTVTGVDLVWLQFVFYSQVLFLLFVEIHC